MGRSHSPTRCPRCQLFKELCLCKEVTALTTRTRVLAVMHIRELPLTTNTVRLLELALTNIEVRLHGRKGADEVDLKDVIEDPGLHPLLLFPSTEAVPVLDAVIPEGKTPILIVPDGNWRQASKMTRRLAQLKGVRHVTLPPGPPSEYILRKEPRPECLSTFESVSRALSALERNPELNDSLMKVFRMKVDRTLWARGLLSPDQVRGGVPEAAIRSFFEAGKRGNQLKE